MKRSDVLAFPLAAIFMYPASGRAQASAAIRIGGSTGEATAEGYFAIEGGFFKKAGIPVELTTFSNAGTITAAVASGVVDVGVTNIGSVAVAHSRGIPVQLIAPSTIVDASKAPLTVLAVPMSSPLNGPRDFVGKTIALSNVGDLAQAAVMTWIDTGGGDSRRVQYVQIRNSDLQEALTNKLVDAAVLVEPWITSSRAQIRIIGRPYDSVGSHLMTFGWVSSKNWIDRNRPRARDFLSVMAATAAWANHNPVATAPLLAALSKIPRDTISRMNRNQYGEKIEVNQIQPIIDAVARYGFVRAAFPAIELIASLK